MDVVEVVNVLSLLLIGMFNQLCAGDSYCSVLRFLYIVSVVLPLA